MTLSLSAIKKRADFLALRHAKRANAPGFLMLAGPNPTNTGAIRVGLTVTKKMGGAVIRNRMRRRLRHAAHAILPVYGTADTDYVLVARKAAYDRNYEALLDDMKRALLSLRRDTK